MRFTLKATAALAALVCGTSAFAVNTGGFATTLGADKTPLDPTKPKIVKSVSTMQGLIDEIAAAKTAKRPLEITYTGNEDALIAQMVKDHTLGSDGKCPNPRWNDAYRNVEVKAFTYGLTIIGGPGSSANFGIPVINSSDVIIKNMKIGALAGGANDADMIRIDNTPNVWIDHNELFAVNNECPDTPGGDTTFEAAIDIKKGSTNVTVSYNYIHDSKKVGLDGSSATDLGGGRNITFHHNHYYNVGSRLPLQRGGIVHAYNNLYNKITGSGINVRTGGKAVVERNYFMNSLNPVTCRIDTNNCGTWYLDSNNTTKAADNATYGITWDDDDGKPGTLNADTWTSTLSAKPSLSYSYEPVSAQCVKDKLAQYAGVGKNGATLVASACGTATSSSSAASSVASSRASSSVASSVASSRASSSAASSRASSSAASSRASSSAASSASSSTPTPPVLSGTGDYPSGWSKCADLGETCTAKPTGWVAFGRKGNWVLKYVGSGKTIACSVAAFGSDPVGNPNKCSTK